MNRVRIFVGGGVAAVLIVAGIAQLISSRQAVVLEPVPFQPVSAEESDTVVTHDLQDTSTDDLDQSPVSSLLSIAEGDRIASWDFKGVYAGRPDLVAKAESEIRRLSDLAGKGIYSDVTLYTGIAGQYELLGDGKQAYDYLNRAIAADRERTTGLPWHNLGVLMERLHAFNTARIAYEKATLVQSEWKQWHYAYLEFLTSRMKEDVNGIEKALAAAERNIGQDPYVAEWQTLR